MEESPSSTIWDGKITGIRFGLATCQEICTSSINDFPISHATQLANPFLGLPLESGKCESCGAAEPGQCEGHFGYIELPIPIYHPSHLSELKRLLSLLCLKCLKMKNRKFQVKSVGILERALSSCCEEASQISIDELKTADGACYLGLKLPSRSRLRDGAWNFLEKYGYRYGDGYRRPLLASEVMIILKKIPEETKKKLAGKGFFPQDGYILQYIPVPPNCLSVPDVSDGITVMSSDLSITILKKVLKQVEIIKGSRSGIPNFESHEVEANDLQAAVAQYLEVRGTSKASRDVDTRYGISKAPNNSSTKAWLEKMKTLFIRKGSGFSSRSVITGDAYKGVHEIGLPFEIAQRITFEERVTRHNMQYLQKLVDEKLCLTYRDGSSTYSLREGSKGHTFLRPGQVVHRRVMDGDIVFINRPPTTHKHSLQALSVYVHDDHTVKINPLICGPLSADFDGDCVHLFYPQSLAAKAEVLELFSVEKQLLSSHTGNFNLQMATDSLLSLKILFKNYFLTRAAAQQLAMFVSNSLPQPSLLKVHKSGPCWTALQMLQTALPRCFDCSGERHLILKSDILRIDFNRDAIQSILNDIVTSIFFEKGPYEVLNFFNSLQPMLMENLFIEGYSVSLKDFSVARMVLENIQNSIQDISPLLYQLRLTYNELVELQMENHLRLLRVPVANFILKSSAMGNVVDSKSDSAIIKVVQQIGFLGLQLSDRGKFYSKTLVRDMASLFQKTYPFRNFPCEEFGLVRSCLFHGLDPFQEMVHSISAREVIVRSSRGLTEPGTLFKNLMAILRDVVICYDGTVRNVCSNSIIQFEYGVKPGTKGLFAAGEPVGVLAATAMSNPAYKAVLDSSPSSNCSWEMMKEILLCPVNFRNDLSVRRVTLYLNDCDCGRKYCRENAAYIVKNQLKKVSLKDIAFEFLIEYNGQQTLDGSYELDGNFVGHVHLSKALFQDLNISMQEVCEKCQDTVDSFRKKKKFGHLFKKIKLSASDGCSFGQPCDADFPCLKFFWQDTFDSQLERISINLANDICPVLLETIIKGDPRVSTANIIWISPDTTTWIRNPCKNQKGELALDVVLEKGAVKQSGDAWRIVLDSCLPVIHLIDTSRSIPHAIKQVQELLGISCAFEQAVQRLSTSVSMVAKGVVNDHLILLANSMTCSGNMIGFNSGGIKALSRSLNVQVPFTEATLFMPKKCFERAAEKCHVDSLSSIVGSCSWGKHVAVGTGSRFDVLWGTREVAMNQPDQIDVYNFLHLVRSSSQEETTSGCLGAEIDNFEMEIDDVEWALSPERSSDKPIFEDSSDFQSKLDNPIMDWSRPAESNWEKASPNTESNGREWVVDKGQNWGSGNTVSKPSGWSGWGANVVPKEDNHSTRAEDIELEKSTTAVTWGSSNFEASEVGMQPQTGYKKESSANLWSSSQNIDSTDGKEWAVNKTKIAGDSTSVSKSNNWSSWGVQSSSNEAGQGKVQSNLHAAWHKDSPINSWNSNQNDDPSGGQEWGVSKKQSLGAGNTMSKPSGLSSWGVNTVRTDDESPVDAWKSSQNDDPSGGKEWGVSKKQNLGAGNTMSKPSGRSSWGANTVRTDDESPFNARNSSQNDGLSSCKEWGFEKKKDFGAGKTVSKSSGWSSWGGNSSRTDDMPSSATQETVPVAQSKTSDEWGSMKSDGPWNVDLQSQSGKWKESGDGKGWLAGKNENLAAGTTVSKPHGWSRLGADTAPTEDNLSAITPEAEEVTPSKASLAWGSSDEGLNRAELQSRTEQQKESPVNLWSPSQNGMNEQSQWGSANIGSSTEGGQSQWGHPKRFSAKNKREQTESSRGWGSSNAGEWRNKAPGNLTATRQRLDMFTSEEQDILLDVESIMQSIRQIMHQTGYNDGDPLSASDQSYVIDNVFNHHPDKSAKMGAGIDYVMVSKHTSFQESRCFYVVSTDGRKEDFSYRKCLENFLKEKYPDKAESFIGKYFKKPRSGWNRERSVALEEAGSESRQ